MGILRDMEMGFGLRWWDCQTRGALLDLTRPYLNVSVQEEGLGAGL